MKVIRNRKYEFQLDINNWKIKTPLVPRVYIEELNFDKLIINYLIAEFLHVEEFHHFYILLEIYFAYTTPQF